MAAKRDWIDKDFYAALGVSKDADAATIKKGYRKLARENHPDQNPGDDAAERRFKSASEAWGVLGDDESKKDYDEVRRLSATGAFRGHGGGMPQGEGDFSDVFRTIFEQAGGAQGGQSPFGFGQPRRARPQRGQDLLGQITLDWDDSLAGVETTLRMDGNGRSREVTVRIPAGVKDGARVKIAGKGGPGGNGGPAGDVIVTVHVRPHEVWGRSGYDITLELPVTFAEAALGTKLTVPLPLGGSKRIRIPAGTSSGTTLRIRGAGAPRGKRKAGDLLVTTDVQVPEDLSKEQERLIEQLALLDDVAERDRRFASVQTQETVQ